MYKSIDIDHTDNPTYTHTPDVSRGRFVVYKYTQASINATSNNITSISNKLKSHIQW